jgi:hypothetical protein
MRKDYNTMRTLGAAAAVLCLVAIAGCTTNTSIANVTMQRGSLEMAVGTINDSNDTLGIGGVSLNVVTAFRNSYGNSAYQTPGQFSLTGPDGTVVASSGSGCDELFGYGLFPGCVTDLSGEALVGVPPAYNPADSCVCAGYSLGFFGTDTAVVSGQYSIQTKVPVNGGSLTYTATATLPSPATELPDATGVTGFVSDDAGGGTFTIGNPTSPRDRQRVRTQGILTGTPTEYLLVISAQGTSGPVVVATAETTSTTATITGTGACPAGGSPIPCGPFNVYVIDADYPLVEAGPPASQAMKPTLVGSAGTADISVSPVADETEGGGGARPRSTRALAKP